MSTVVPSGGVVRKRTILINVEEQDLMINQGRNTAIDRDMQKLLIRCCRLMPWLKPKRLSVTLSQVRISELSLTFDLLHVRKHARSHSYWYRTTSELRGERFNERLIFCDDLGLLFGGTAPKRFSVIFDGPSV